MRTPPLTAPLCQRSPGEATTRTQRALVRGYWSEEYTVHQIGEYLNLSRGEIWHAINNRANDDLSKDEDYRNGVMGDVINVEDKLLDIDPQEHGVIKKEEEEEEDKVQIDLGRDLTDRESSKLSCYIRVCVH